MSGFDSYYRLCRFCGDVGPTYRGPWSDHRALIHYSIRSYAHPDCLVEHKGWRWLLDQSRYAPIVARQLHPRTV